MKAAREFVESGKARKGNGSRHSEIQTVEQAIDKWLEVCEDEGRDEREPVSPSTLENYRWRSRTMKAFAWQCELRDLQEADVIAFRSWLKRGCSPDQAQKVLSSFHSVLIEMQRRGVISDDPAQNVALRSDPRLKEPVQIPSIAEFQEILRAADRLANSKNNEIASAWERYRPMIYLAADSGMRPQEYLVLPIEGLQDKGVNVLQALDRSNRLGPPKTKAGRRYIPVSSESLDMAKHYSAKHGTGGLVFPTRREGSYQRYNVFVRRGFHKLMEEAGLVTEVKEKGKTKLVKHYTPYSLRHFFASMLIEKNKGLKYIQTVMGHENITMTLNVYGHIIRRKETDELHQDGGILHYIPKESCGESVADAI
ncbi:MULTISPECIES: site-specific integrase [unclassified Mesorhizobium]|uniref:tyrosine-type recombinase/integrase n=1 Tax=unclassified Mesorhizobium TaxID=325217 RepID=UPI002416C383|nr:MULTISPECIES: site-specific integrase [unclassified Mesorhizobium]MDG4901390.1 site-specific integrase [Mesorhizobium sp. WSM4962]MDG4918878.1 site-specific integrase [Mesorhizobium sp. WSM4989]